MQLAASMLTTFSSTGVTSRQITAFQSYTRWQRYITEWHLPVCLLNACSRQLH